MDSTQLSDEGQVYQLDKLMEETRSLAAKYRAATGQTLPVTHDLACYDAIRLLGLIVPEELEAGIDAIQEIEDATDKFTIKGRVQFSNAKGKQQRIGQLNLDSQWTACLLVLLNDDYLPTLILRTDRNIIEEVMASKPANKRGAMTVAQFRKIATVIWENLAEPENVD